MADNTLPQDFRDANADNERHRKEFSNNPVLMNELNKLDQNQDGKVNKQEATEYAKTVKENMAKAPPELKAAVKDAPELTPENAADNFKNQTGKDISPGAAEILAKAAREGAALPNPTGNTGGAGSNENGQEGKSKGVPGQEKDEKEAGAKPNFFDQIGKFITAILSMLSGLNKEEQDHAKNDMEGKATANGGKPPSSNQVADSVRSVTGGDRDVTKLPDDVLAMARLEGKKSGINSDQQANVTDLSGPSYVAAKPQQQAAAGLTA